ncbi:hypothetical protein [Natrinema amylolyticum]|nr:hypothetical protein [Natrinema amylolyticum]
MFEHETTGTDCAWAVYCERGIVTPEYATEIAERRRLCREWAAAGEPLR